MSILQKWTENGYRTREIDDAEDDEEVVVGEGDVGRIRHFDSEMLLLSDFGQGGQRSQHFTARAHGVQHDEERVSETDLACKPFQCGASSGTRA